MKTRFRIPRLLIAALVLALSYGVTSMLGLEDWVGVLSGTPVPGVDSGVAVLGAAAHVMSFFSAVLLAPILLIAAALLEVTDLGVGGQRGGASRQGSGAQADGSTPVSGATSLRSS